MKLRIKFSTILADKISKYVEIEVDKAELTLGQFIDLIEQQSWSGEVIENRHIKSPIVLIIDNQLIQFSDNSEIIISANSDINFQVMFAGG